MTQEQLLEEAKETELLNLQSLEKYQQLELEKKKTRVVKKVSSGPTISYLSTSMPSLEDFSPEMDGINVEEDEVNKDAVVEPETVNSDVKQCCERTFITFSDDCVLKDNFSQSKEKPPLKNICPITRY